MIRADFVYINGDFIYSVLRQKIVIYNKKTLEKTREIFIKNVSKIFFDNSVDRLLLITTNGVVEILSLSTYELIKQHKLVSESAFHYYDLNSHLLFLTCLSFNNIKTYYYRISVLGDEIESKIDSSLLLSMPYTSDDSSIQFAYTKINDNEQNILFLEKYKKDKFELIETQKIETSLSGLFNLHGHIFYNMEGIENLLNNSIIRFENLGIDGPIIIAKRVGRFYFLSSYLNAYVLSDEFEILYEFHSDNMGQAISDIAIDDTKIYLLKGANIIVYNF